MMQENTKPSAQESMPRDYPANETEAPATQSNALKEEKKKKREQNAAKKAERLAKKEERMAKRKARMAAKKARREERKLKPKQKKNEDTATVSATGDDTVVLTKEGDAESVKGEAEEIAANILKEEQLMIVKARKQARQKFLRHVKGQPELRKQILQQLRIARQKSTREAQVEKKKQRQEKNKQRKGDVVTMQDQVSSLNLHGEEWEEVKREAEKNLAMTGN